MCQKMKNFSFMDFKKFGRERKLFYETRFETSFEENEVLRLLNVILESTFVNKSFKCFVMIWTWIWLDLKDFKGHRKLTCKLSKNKSCKDDQDKLRIDFRIGSLYWKSNLKQGINGHDSCLIP